MQPQRGARGITQLQYLLQLSLANFRELRKDEVGSVGVLSLVATGTSETSSFGERRTQRCIGTTPQPAPRRGYKHPQQTSKPYCCLRAAENADQVRRIPLPETV